MKFDDEKYADTFYNGVKYLPLQTSLKKKIRKIWEMEGSTF